MGSHSDRLSHNYGLYIRAINWAPASHRTLTEKCNQTKSQSPSPSPTDNRQVALAMQGMQSSYIPKQRLTKYPHMQLSVFVCGVGRVSK